MSESSPRVAVVGVPGRWSSEALADAFAERLGERHLVDFDSAVLDLERGTVTCGELDLGALDGLVVKKLDSTYSPDMLDRIEILRFLEASGVRVFSRTSALGRLIDRLACTVALRAADIPMPPTVVTEDVDAVCEAVERFDEAVLKPLYSTKARGMQLISARDGRAAVRETVQGFARENRVIYVQKKIPIPGHDLGMAFVAGEYLGTYARVGSDEAWNTTIRAGGRYAAYEPRDETIALARRAQAIFDLDFTTVDVVEGETDDETIVFEVSAFGGFRGLKEGLGIDAAGRYADSVIEALS